MYLKKKKTKGEKRPQKDNKIFLKKQKKKSVSESNESLSEEQKEKLVKYIRSYYITHYK